MAQAKKNTQLFTATRLAGAAALLAAGTLGTTPAQAHDELVSTNPAADAVLPEAPADLELTYSGDIMDVAGANQVRVTNAAGELITEEEPEVDGKTVTQQLPADTEEDTFTVSWRVVSSDGHPIQGTFNYTVGQGAPTAASSEAAESQAAENSGSENSASESQAASPAVQATEGLPTGAKIALAALAAAAIIGGLAVVLAKTKKRG